MAPLPRELTLPQRIVQPAQMHAGRQATSPKPPPAKTGPLSTDGDGLESIQVRRTGQSLAFLASVVVHVALLLTLALWVREAGLPTAGIELIADRGEASSGELEELSTFELTPQAEPEQAAQAPPVAEQVNLDFELTQLFGPPAEGNGLNPALLTLSGKTVSSTLSQGSGRGATFFGSYAEGNRFIFVLDSSRSMQGDRWTYACNELIDSLNKLNPDQEFYIICFDLKTSFLFNKAPPKAEYHLPTDAKIAQVRRWLRGRTLGRATMPAEALRAALELAPDAIFLLSDGELQDNSVAMLRRLNTKHSSASTQIPIHAIHLFSEFGRESLEIIAFENGGSFTHVGK